MKRFIPITLIGFGAGLFFIYTVVSQNALLEKLDAEGKTAIGQIEGGTEKDGSVELKITYTPEGGEPITKEFPVAGDLKDQLMEDGKIAVETVDVRYLPSAPEKARVVGQFAPGLAGLIAGVVLSVLCLLLLIFLLTRKSKAN